MIAREVKLTTPLVVKNNRIKLPSPKAAREVMLELIAFLGNDLGISRYSSLILLDPEIYVVKKGKLYQITTGEGEMVSKQAYTPKGRDTGRESLYETIKEEKNVCNRAILLMCLILGRDIDITQPPRTWFRGITSVLGNTYGARMTIKVLHYEQGKSHDITTVEYSPIYKLPNKTYETFNDEEVYAMFEEISRNILERVIFPRRQEYVWSDVKLLGDSILMLNGTPLTEGIQVKHTQEYIEVQDSRLGITYLLENKSKKRTL